MQWLNDNPSTWSTNQSYIHLQAFCADLQVVNDAAERAEKDVTDYAKVTCDAAHRDAVIVVANDHMGRITNLKKGNL